MMKPTCMILSAILAVAGCAIPQGQAFRANLSESPVVSGGSFSSGGGISVAAEIREKDGKTLVCGVWAQSSQQSVLSKGKAAGVVASGSIFLDDDRIVQDLSFMPEVAPAASYSGAAATCRLSERPWQNGDDARAIVIRIPRQIVTNEVGDFGGPIVRFSQTGPGAGSSEPQDLTTDF